MKGAYEPLTNFHSVLLLQSYTWQLPRYFVDSSLNYMTPSKNETCELRETARSPCPNQVLLESELPS